MNRLKIAVAQVPLIRGDIASNLSTHLKAVGKAAAEGVNYLVFPELSLTGYEPELASSFAFSPADERLNPLAEAAKMNQIYIGVGVPLAGEGLPKIGLVIFYPTGATELYEKIYLHSGEEKYFSPGHAHHFMTVNGLKIANAICADTNNKRHAEYCANEKAVIYMAGVLFTEQGYEADEKKLISYAREYNMLVAIANHNSATGGWVPCGKSTIWSASGVLATANGKQSALVIAELRDEAWVGSVVEL